MALISQFIWLQVLKRVGKMKYDFKLQIEVDEYIELETRTPYQAYDSRDATSYTDFKLETKRFQTLPQAQQWLADNLDVEVKSAVLIKNVLNQLNLGNKIE